MPLVVDVTMTIVSYSNINFGIVFYYALLPSTMRLG